MCSRQLIIPQPHPPTHSLHVMVSDFCESGCSYKCFLKRARQRAYVDTSSLFSCAPPLTVRVCTWVNSLRFCTLLLVGWVKHFSALNDPRQWRDDCKRACIRTHMFSSIQAHTHMMPISHTHIHSCSHTHYDLSARTHTNYIYITTRSNLPFHLLYSFIFSSPQHRWEERVSKRPVVC